MVVGFRLLFLIVVVTAFVQYCSAIGSRRPLPVIPRKHTTCDPPQDESIFGTSDAIAQAGTATSEQRGTLLTSRRAFRNVDLGEDLPNNLQPREERSKVHPLLMRSTTASVCLLFGLLIWRSLASYEMADQFSSQTVRLLTTIPIVMILFANVVGLAVNLIKPLNFKNHLKAILAANIMREWVEAAYNLFMMLFAASNAAIPRTEYMGRIFMNVWWNLICFSFIKSRWVLSEPVVPGRQM